MDNMYQPPSGGPQDNWPTQQFGPGGQQQPQPGQQRPSRGSRGSRKLRWSAGIALAAILAGGGALAATQLTGSPSANASQNSGQAASLNTILSSASTPVAGAGAAAGASESSGSSAAGQGSAAGTASTGSSAAGNDAAALSQNVAPAAHPAATACKRAIATLRTAGRRHAARVVRRACRRGAVRRLVALHGLHGQFTVKTKSGTKTIGFARGVIQSVTSSAINIKAADNTTWTWDLVSTTVIRENGKKVSASSLSAGEQVFAGGQVVSGANDARLIVIRPASSPASGSGNTSGSATNGS